MLEGDIIQRPLIIFSLLLLFSTSLGKRCGKMHIVELKHYDMEEALSKLFGN